MSPSGGDEPRSRWPLSTVQTVVVAALVAAATAIGTGLGEKVLDRFEDDPPLLTASAEEVIAECGTGLFVGAPRSDEILAAKVDLRDGWEAFRSRTRAVPADFTAVEVSIQGETDRKITLTGIDFEVTRGKRPDGAVFANPCGDDVHGYGVNVDLDATPPQIVKSNGDPEAALLVHAPAERKPDKPLRFPWTVSVTDPLLLTVVGLTKTCLCTWSAAITWRSGARSGVIDVDDGGRGFRVAGGAGVRRYVSSGPDSTWASVPASD